MRFVNDVSYGEVLVKLDKLNNSRRVFERSTDEDIRRIADLDFANCYDWLIAHNVLVCYDEGPKLWILRSF